MDVSSLSTIITSGFIFLVTIAGAILLSFGIGRKREKSTALGVVLLAFAIFLSILYFPELATSLAGFSTIAVAVFAGWQVFENIRLREENRRLAVEERHMIAIEKIRIWAVETFHALATPNSRDTFPSWRIDELAKLQHSSVESTSILYFAERVGGDLEERVIDANLNFQKYFAILMGEKQIELFKKRYEIEDDIRPINNNEEAVPLIKDLMDFMKEVIRSAVAELAPKR